MTTSTPRNTRPAPGPRPGVTSTRPAPPAAPTPEQASANEQVDSTLEDPAAADPPASRLREDLLNPDPLLDCLLEVCRLHGVSSSRAALTSGLPLQDGLLTVSLVERAAARAGMAVRLQ
ncbi:MAG TPA: hypothetical protein PK797_07500, partial [Burkholderiaceae bacterium]|nr:hypothetical protein [Burkholderiaceae bacterium]